MQGVDAGLKLETRQRFCIQGLGVSWVWSLKSEVQRAGSQGSALGFMESSSVRVRGLATRWNSMASWSLRFEGCVNEFASHKALD